MHPDADGPDKAEKARHDPVPEEGRRRPPRQWSRHPRFPKGMFLQLGALLFDVVYASL